MYAFKDRYDVEWDCAIDMGVAMRVNRTDFTTVYSKPVMLNTLTEELLQELTINGGLVAALAYVICKPQIDVRFRDTKDELVDGVSSREMRFLQAFDGDTVCRARTAIFEAIANFFPEMRTMILGSLAKARKSIEMHAKCQQDSMSREEELQEQKIREYYQSQLDKMANRTLESAIVEAKEAMAGQSGTT